MTTREELQKLLDECLIKEAQPKGKLFDELLDFFNKKISYSDLYIMNQYTTWSINAHLLSKCENIIEQVKKDVGDIKDLMNPDWHHDSYNADDEAAFEEKFENKFGNIPI